MSGARATGVLSDISQITTKFWEIVPPLHRQGTCIPFGAIRWPGFSERPPFGRPFGHFLAIQTHLSCRFLLAIDSLGLLGSGSSSQFVDPPQDFPNQVPGHGDFGQLERDIATMADNLSNGLFCFQLSCRA